MILNDSIITINTEELTAHQVRMMKTLNTLIQHVLSTEDEGEYFESSAEVLRICAALIKQANFCKGVKSDIPYGEQVIEYSMDILQEHINSARVVTYDN